MEPESTKRAYWIMLWVPRGARSAWELLKTKYNLEPIQAASHDALTSLLVEEKKSTKEGQCKGAMRSKTVGERFGFQHTGDGQRHQGTPTNMIIGKSSLSMWPFLAHLSGVRATLPDLAGLGSGPGQMWLRAVALCRSAPVAPCGGYFF